MQQVDCRGEPSVAWMDRLEKMIHDCVRHFAIWNKNITKTTISGLRQDIPSTPEALRFVRETWSLFTFLVPFSSSYDCSRS
jgi:hypothetical protein